MRARVKRFGYKRSKLLNRKHILRLDGKGLVMGYRGFRTGKQKRDAMYSRMRESIKEEGGVWVFGDFTPGQIADMHPIEGINRKMRSTYIKEFADDHDYDYRLAPKEEEGG